MRLEQCTAQRYGRTGALRHVPQVRRLSGKISAVSWRRGFVKAATLNSTAQDHLKTKVFHESKVLGSVHSARKQRAPRAVPGVRGGPTCFLGKCTPGFSWVFDWFCLPG